MGTFKMSNEESENLLIPRLSFSIEEANSFYISLALLPNLPPDLKQARGCSMKHAKDMRVAQ